MSAAPGDATTGERQAVSQAAVDAAFPILHGGHEFRHEPALRADLERPVREALEAAQRAGLDFPEPSDAERVEAAHQRIHKVHGRRGACPGVTCAQNLAAHAALDLTPPVEFLFRSNDSQTDAGRQS